MMVKPIENLVTRREVLTRGTLGLSFTVGGTANNFSWFNNHANATPPMPSVLFVSKLRRVIMFSIGITHPFQSQPTSCIGRTRGGGSGRPVDSK